ncbi:MAG: hypothetical protein U0228_12455 [Myxococcaceae bacterium]
MPSLSDLKAQILKDRRVTKDEAYQLIEEVMKGSITQRERKELHELLIDHGSALEDGARKELEKALGISSRKKITRADSVKDAGELELVEKVLKLVDAAGGKPTLFELTVGDQVENPAFKGALADGLKKFISSGKSSLTAAQAIKLASGLSAGQFVSSDEELFRTGDRLGVSVHYPDGSKQDTHGLVVSTGNQPLVLVVNKNGRFQMIRQEPKSREQLAVTAVLASGR